MSKIEQSVKPDFSLIVTIGPSILGKLEQLQAIANAGPCIFRINGAHADANQVRIYEKVIRSILPDASIMLDLPGNKIRTANLSCPLTFAQGEIISMLPDHFNFPDIVNFIQPGTTILANDSTTEFKVQTVDRHGVKLLAKHSGTLADRKGMHIPGLNGKLPFLFEKDRVLARAAAEAKLSHISLSYTRNAKDIREAKRLFSEFGNKAGIIAKIETLSATEHIGEILEEADMINVDRGDLSTETGLLRLGEYQDCIIAAAHKAGKPVFLATQFFKNMETKPVPLISEVLDLGNSLRKGIAGIQLSEETAVGLFPIQCVKFVWDMHHTHLCRKSGKSDASSTFSAEPTFKM